MSLYDIQINALGTPSEQISPSKKQLPEYSLGYAQYIYNYLKKDSSGIFNSYNRYSLATLYGQGQQPTEIYLNALSPLVEVTIEEDGQIKNTGTYTRLGFEHIDWEKKLPVIPAYQSVFVGMLLADEQDVTLRAVDEFSEAERENKKAEIWANKMNEDVIARANQMFGVNTQEQLPETIDELESLFELGAEKLNYESDLEEAIANDLSLSETKEVRRKQYIDIFQINCVASKVDIDPETNQTRISYCDPRKYGCESSRFDNYRNSGFGAEYKDYTISEIRNVTGWSEEKLFKIAQKYNGKYGNSVSGNLTAVIDPNVRQMCNWDTFVVPVLDCWWKGYEYTYTKVKLDENGEVSAVLKELPFEQGYERTKNGYNKRSPDRRVDETSKEFIYQAKWVIDTEYVFDNGKMSYQIRNGQHVEPPFTLIRFNGLSLCERCMPFADNAQLAFYRYQDFQSIMEKPGYAYDIEAAIATADSIGEGTKPKDIFGVRKSRGSMFFKFNSHTAFDKFSTSGYPFAPLTGGFGAYLDEIMKEIAWNLSNIQQMIGISPYAAGQAPAPYTGAQEAQLSVAGTANAIREYADGCIRINEITLRKMATRICYLIAYSDKAYKSYQKAIGEESVKRIKDRTKEGVDYTSWGVEITVRPTENDKLLIMEALKASLMAGRDGKMGLRTSSYFACIRMLNQRNGVKKAQMFLSRMEMLADKKQDEREANNYQQQMNIASESNKQKMQQKLSEIMIKAEQDLEKQKQNLDLTLRNLLLTDEVNQGAELERMVVDTVLQGTLQQQEQGVEGQPQQGMPQQGMQQDNDPLGLRG